MESNKPNNIKSINANPQRIIKWLMEEERCLMHGNVSDLPITSINLSENDLDKLISQGEHIVKARDEQAFRLKDCNNKS